MNKLKSAFSAIQHKGLCLVLLFLLNLLLIIHSYPLALILLINLITLGYVLLTGYRNNLTQNHSINIVETMLLSIKNGDHNIRAELISSPTLKPIITHLNELAESIQENQAALASQKALLSQIIDSIDSALMVFDRSGVAFANKYAVRTFSALYNDAPYDWFCELYRLQNEGSVIIEVEGQAHTFLIESQECYIHNHAHVLLVLKQVDNILYQQEKEALSRFVRILSHEINNTLAPIGTVSRSLKKRLSTNFDKQQFADGLTLINERALYLKTFMDNYVALAKLPKPNKQVVELDGFCNELRQVYPTLNIIQAPEILGFFDASQIKQVLCHLINNAIEAAENVNVTLNVSAKNDTLCVDVIDNGPGFSNQAEALAPFYTTKSKGTGVGLMLSKNIISNHGQKLVIENLEPQGAKVSFSLELIKSS